MATYTSNYGWTKPSGSDNVDISVLNNNLDDQDSTIHDAFLNMAPPFSESSTYAVDDIVLYDTGLYKCHTPVVTPGAWTGSTNWQVYKLSEGGSGGGGTSNYNDLTNKPSINGVTLSGNKTTSDLGITASGVGAIPSTDKGANGGVAELDSNGKVPSSQLPSYVDDVLSYASQSAFPATGETGKIYIAEDTNKTYRWSGSAYAEISASLALGETSSTAYRGDRGKTAYDHSQTSGNPHGTTASDVGLGNVPNVSTNDQEPTFTEASTRNNIASGEKLSVIFGKIQKFFNDLKTVAFTGSYTDLSNKPQVNGVELSGNKTSNDLGIANQSDIAPEFNNTTVYARGDLCYHEGTLYEFNQAHAVGDWNSAEVDEKNMAEIAKCILNSGITLIPESGVTFEVVRIYTQNKLVIAQIKLKFSSIPTTETKIATFSGFDVGYGYAVGVVGTTNTEEAGIFILSGNRLYVKLRSGLSTSSTYCMTIISINLL